jgi:hypothetical protein
MTIERDPAIKLTMIPRMVMRNKMDGSGFEFVTDYSGHKGHLQVGNVSIAFDGRNNFDARNDRGEIDEYSETVVELSENRDDPVRYNNDSVTGSYSAAEKMLYALAKDLGYSIKKHDSDDNPLNADSDDDADDDELCSDADFAELMDDLKKQQGRG